MTLAEELRGVAIDWRYAASTQNATDRRKLIGPAFKPTSEAISGVIRALEDAANEIERLQRDRICEINEDLLAALSRLTDAAANRENNMGDPIRFLKVQAELRDATTNARAAIAKARSQP